MYKCSRNFHGNISMLPNLQSNLLMFLRGSIICLSGNLKGFLCHLCQLCFFKAQRWLPTTTKNMPPEKQKDVKNGISLAHMSLKPTFLDSLVQKTSLG